MAYASYRYGNLLLSPPHDQVGDQSDVCIELEIDESGIVVTNQTGRDLRIKLGQHLAQLIRLQEAG